jgi:putative transposase
MPRRPRGELRGAIHHVINRGNNRHKIFSEDRDFEHFINALRAAKALVPTRLYAFSIMSNHFHAIIEPQDIDTLSRFIHRWMTKHAKRHQRQSNRTGHIWQGRFRSFPIEHDDHFKTVVRYVLRNPVRAGIVERPQSYQWSSLRFPQIIDEWPTSNTTDASTWLDEPFSAGELGAIRASVNHQLPFGSEPWTARIAKATGQQTTPRQPGRPSTKTGTGSDFRYITH